MAKSVDERVVQMEFDNKQFESGIKTSLNSLDKLKAGLNFDAATKSLANIEKAAKNFSLSGIEKGIDTISSKFTTLGIIGVTAMQRITNAAITAGTNLVKSLTIDPVLTGFNEYETKMNAITTILTNTASKGTTLDDVNNALNELNTYADKTIYNFAEMTRNIGTFTAAGVDLETATKAIQGIANLAAGSGSSSTQASTAMYQLSQAIAAGRVSLQDWNSVVNAGMGGELFQNALKETAKQMGIVVDESVSFRESISATGGKQSWLTSDVLVKTLEKFADDETLLKAATQVKTFTQLIDTMKESVQSGWAQSWEYIIGDREQAAELFTSISDGFNSIIQPSTDARNAALQFWNANGGRAAVIEGITNVLKTLGNILKPIGDAFKDAFPAITGERLVDISEKFRDLTEKFKIGEGTAQNIHKTFQALFDVLAFGSKIVGTVVTAFGKIVGAILPVGDGIFGITGSIGGFISWLIDAVDYLDIFGIAIEGVATPIEFLVGLLSGAAKAIGDFVSSIANKFQIPSFENIVEAAKQLKDFKGSAEEAMDSVKGNAAKKFEPIVKAFASIGDAASAAKDKFKEFADGVKKFLTPIGQTIKKAFSGVTFDDVLGAGSLVGIAVLIRKAFKRIDEAASNFDKVINSITGVLDTARESLEVWQKSIQANTLIKIAGAVAILAFSLIALTFVDPKKLQSGLIGVTVLLAEVVATMEILSKFKVTGIAGAATSMVIMAVAISVLASALSKLKEFQDWDTTWPALLSVEALLLGLSVAAKLMSKNVNGAELIKSSIGLIIFAHAVKQMADAMIKFSALDGESIAKSLGSLAAILTGITVFIRVSKLDKLKGAKATIIEIASSMVIMYAAIKLFSTMDVNELVQGLASVGALIGALTISLRVIGSVQMKGVATSLIGMSTALTMLLIPIKVLSGMDIKQLQTGLGAVASALAVLSISLGALGSLKVGGGTFAGIGAGLIAMATALNIILVPIAVLGHMSWKSLALGLGSLVVVLVALGATTAALAPFGASLIMVAGAFALFGVAAVGVGAGILALSAGLAALAVSGAAGIGVLLGLLTGVLALIPVFMKELAMGVVVFAESLADMAPVLGNSLVVIVTEALESLRKVAPALSETILYLVAELLKDLVQYAPQIAQSLIDLFISALDIVEQNVPVIVEKIASVLKAIVGTISDMVGEASPEDIQNLILSLSGLIICFQILSATKTTIKGALKNAVAMAGVMAILSGMLLIISLLPVDDTLEIAESLAVVMLSLSATMAIVSMIPIQAAATGIAGLGVFVAGLTAILAALGGLNQIPGFSWLIGEGSTVLGQIGTAIGNFIGGIAGGALTGITGSFPQIGSDLSAFMTNAAPFFQGLQNVNAGAMEGVKALAGAILVLTGADILQALTSWFTGGTNLAEFGQEIAAFAPYFKSYADQMAGVDPEVVSSTASAAQVLAEFAGAIPNSGGLVSLFTGENSLTEFGKELAKFGPYFAQYASSLSGIDPEVVTASGNAAKSLTEMASAIPNSGGLVSLFTGDNSLADFGKELAKFGPYFAQYASSVSGIDGTVVQASVNAASALSEFASGLPNSGGLGSLFGGDNTLSDFGKQLVTLGTSLSQYYWTISAVDMTAITTSASSIQALSNTLGSLSTGEGSGISSFISMIDQIPAKMNTAVSSITTAFSSMAISITANSSIISTAFGRTIDLGIVSIQSKSPMLANAGRVSAMNFVTAMATSMISSAPVLVTSTNTMFQMVLVAIQRAIQNGRPKIQNEGKQLIQAFIKGLTSQNSEIASSLNDTLSSTISNLRSYHSSFYSVGVYMASGLASGIRSGRSGVINAASTVASEALTAAKQELDVNSPSKKMIAVGKDTDQGLINGLIALAGKVRDAGETVAKSAISGVGILMDQIPSILSNDADFSPRITPVLDLSQMRSGSAAMNDMFSNTYAIHAKTNSDLGEISRNVSNYNRYRNGGLESDAIQSLDKRIGELENTILTISENRLKQPQIIETHVDLNGKTIAKATAQYMPNEIAKVEKFQLRREGRR